MPLGPMLLATRKKFQESLEIWEKFVFFFEKNKSQMLTKFCSISRGSWNCFLADRSLKFGYVVELLILFNVAWSHASSYKETISRVSRNLRKICFFFEKNKSQMLAKFCSISRSSWNCFLADRSLKFWYVVEP